MEEVSVTMDDSTPVSIELLRKMPLFGGLSDDALKLIIESGDVVRVSAADYFFRQGDPGKSLYCLIEGSVSVERSISGKPLELGKLSAGDCIGEMALIDFQPRSASVRATSDCHALEIPGSSLRALFKHDLEQYLMIMMNMGREVSRRLRKADERLFEMLEKKEEPHGKD